MRTSLLTSSLILAVAFSSTAAHGQTATVSDHQKATEAFDRGREFVRQGACNKAIPSFQASVAFERSVGALLNLGDCLFQQNRFMEALDEFRTAEQLAIKNGDTRRNDAREGIGKTEGHLFKISLQVVHPGGDMEFKVDGKIVPARAISDGYVVEQGPHKVEAKRGAETWTSPELVGNSGGSITLKVLFPSEEPKVAPVAPVVAAPAQPEETGAGISQKTVGLIVGGVGVAGVAVGSIFGFMAMGQNSDAKSACGAGGYASCTPANQADVTSAHDSAKTDATVSTIFFIGGGAALATGAVLYFTAPSTPSSSAARIHVSPTLARGGAGLSLLGSF